MEVRDKESDKDFRKEREEEGRAAAFHLLFLPTTSQLKSPHTKLIPVPGELEIQSHYLG